MNYEEWLKSVPEEIVADVGWHDVTKLMQHKRMLALANQLYRALGSISTNIAEGYSRGTGKDRARFYEYALGSARESRDWYYKGRHILSEPVTQHRLRLLTQIIRLLITMIPQQRGTILREPSVPYQKDTPVTPERLDNLLKNVLLS